MKFMETLKSFVNVIIQLFTFMLSRSLSKIFCFRKKICCCCRKAKRRTKYYLTSNNDKGRHNRNVEVSYESKESDKIKQISHKIIDDCSVNDYSACKL